MTTIRDKFNQEIKQSAKDFGVSEEELTKDEDIEQLFEWFSTGYEMAVFDIQNKLERKCCDQCLDKLFNPKETYEP